MTRARKDTRGRKTKLTAALVKKVKEYAGKGYPDNVIYPLLCVSHQTFYNWKNYGKELLEEEMEALEEGDMLELTAEESLYIEFFESLEAGHAKHKAELIDRWMQASEPLLDVNGHVLKHADWRAIESFLKRRDPDQFGEVARSEIKTDISIEGDVQSTGPLGIPMGMNKEQLEAYLNNSQSETHSKADEAFGTG